MSLEAEAGAVTATGSASHPTDEYSSVRRASRRRAAATSVVPITPPPPAKPGRPAYMPTDKDRETVRLLCAGGITHDRIAGLLGISESTLERRFKTDIAMGQTEIDTLSISTLVDAMRGGGKDALTAAMWWQKSRMGWSEKMIVESDQPAVAMRVVVELVGDPAPAVEQDERRRWEVGPNVTLIN